MNKKRCIIYVRVSTEEQIKGFSLDAQENEDTAFANNLGYEVIKIFREEGISASSLNRPVLQKMMQWGYEHKGEFDAVVFWKWERISRGTEEDYVVLGKFFTTCGIKPLSVTECNDESAEGELLRWITKGINLYELRKISQRTKLGMRQVARTGRKPAGVPIGYKNITNPDDTKSIIVDEKTAPFIHKAFEMYATGNYSTESIEDFLYKNGIRNKKGNRYTKVDYMLKNIFYIGKFIWSGQLYEGTHTPIIERELFDAVQSKFGFKKPKTHDLYFPYTTMIKCSHCGKHYLTAEMKRGAHNSGQYIYYKCRCGVKAIKQDELEIEFMRMLDDIYIPPHEIEALKDGAKEILDAIKDFENKLETPAQIQNSIDIINTRIKKAYKDKLDGNSLGMSEDEWNKMISEWIKEKDYLQIKLNDRIEKSKILYDKLHLLMMFMNKLPELFRLAEPRIKREIIQTCCRTLSYDGKNLYIEQFPLFKELKKWKNSIYGAAIGTIVEPKILLKLIENDEQTNHLLLKIKGLIAA